MVSARIRKPPAPHLHWAVLEGAMDKPFYESNVRCFLYKPLCFSCFSCCYNKIPDKNHLRKERFILAYDLRGYSLSRLEALGGTENVRSHCTHGEAQLFIYSETKDNGMVLSILWARVGRGLPSSFKPVWDCSHSTKMWGDEEPNCVSCHHTACCHHAFPSMPDCIPSNCKSKWNKKSN